MDDKPAATTAYVGDQARGYDQLRFSTASGQAINAIERDILQSVVQALPAGAHVVEVGCGTGRLLLALCEQGLRCQGLDASPDMIEQARRKIEPHYPQVELRVAEAAKLPLQDDAADFVYCIRLLNQTADVDYALATVREMLRVAKPRGRVLVEFVNFYRPRLSVKPGKGVHLKPHQLLHAAAEAGGVKLRFQGAFFFGMTAQHRVPGWLRSTLQRIDALMCKIAPRLCARCYALFEKT